MSLMRAYRKVVPKIFPEVWKRKLVYIAFLTNRTSSLYIFIRILSKNSYFGIELLFTKKYALV